MSYACIDRNELDRRGLCEGPPSIIRETIFEPIMEPLFASDPFTMPSRRGGSRFGGGRLGRKPSWKSSQSGPSTSIMQPRGGASYGLAPGQNTARQTARSPQTTTYRASTSYTTTPMRAPQQSYKASGGQTQMRSRGMKGLGQAVDGVSTRWKYATFGLVALAVAQFWWWNKKAPQVLRLGGY